MNRLVKALFEEAEKNLIRHKKLVPCFIIFSTVKDDPMIMDLTEAFSNIQKRNEFLEYFPATLANLLAYKVILISETWLYACSLSAEDVKKLWNENEFSKSGKEYKGTRSCEGIQIVEIYPDSVQGYYKLFSRKGEEILLGDEYNTGNLVIEGIEEIQKALLETH